MEPHLSAFVPTAKESSGWSPQAEVFNRLLQDRIILLGSEIDDAVGNMVIAQLLNALGTYRPLTADEKAAGRQVFGSTLDWDAISVSAESLDNDVIFGLQDWFNGNPYSRAFVTMTLINFDVDDGITTPTLIHELAHVWQSDFTGPMYLAEAVHAQVTDPDAYNYGYSDAADGDGGGSELEAAAGDLERFNREQQGQIAMHYWVRRFQDGRPEVEWKPWEPYALAFQTAA